MMCGAVMLNSCGTTESGAYNGAWFGSILGSAIGGISDGPRGSDWGTIIGMAGGAVVGGAIGNAKEKATKEKLDRYHERIEQKERARYETDNRGHEVRGTRYENGSSNDGGYFDPQNSGDDRITLEGMEAPATRLEAGSEQPVVGESIRMDELKARSNDETTIHVNDLTDMNANRDALQISNIRFIDNNGDGILQAGETAKITFEIRNRSRHNIRDVRPMVVETTGNRYVMVSPGIEVESIAPGSGIKYTASVMAMKRLKAGELLFQLSTLYGNDRQSEVKELNIATQK
jgi:hypothetical protein